MISIRLVQNNDLDQLSRVYVEAFEVADIGESWTQNSASELLSYWIKRQPDLFFVAEEDGNLLGFFCWCQTLVW